MTLRFPQEDGFEAVPATEAVHVRAATGVYRNFGKRVFDILFVLAVSPIGLLLVAVIAGLNLMSRQAPFYVQQRVGKGGRPFRILKIQTMVPNAEAALEAYLCADPDARREWKATQKLVRDPRVTPLGAFLRKTSLDELPQLVNVLKGDMSIVGPRPMLPKQRRLYRGQPYVNLRPGMTGLWQVSDRGSGSFSDRAAFDAQYERELSFLNDLRILGRTVGAVLRCTGR